MSFFDDFLDKLEKLEKTMRNGGLGGTGSIKIRNAVLPSRTILPKPGHNSFSSKIKIPSATNQSKKDPLRSAQQIKNKDIKDIKMKEAQENIAEINKSRIDRLEKALSEKEARKVPVPYESTPYRSELGPHWAGEEQSFNLDEPAYRESRPAAAPKTTSASESASEKTTQQLLAERKQKNKNIYAKQKQLEQQGRPKEEEYEQIDLDIPSAEKMNIRQASLDQQKNIEKDWEAKSKKKIEENDARYEEKQKAEAQKPSQLMTEEKLKALEEKNKKERESGMVGPPGAKLHISEVPWYEKAKKLHEKYPDMHPNPDARVFEQWLVQETKRQKLAADNVSRVYDHLDDSDQEKFVDHLKNKKRLKADDLEQMRSRGAANRRKKEQEQSEQSAAESAKNAPSILTEKEAEYQKDLAEAMADPDFKAGSALTNQEDFKEKNRDFAAEGPSAPIRTDRQISLDNQKQATDNALIQRQEKASRREKRLGDYIRSMLGEKGANLTPAQINNIAGHIFPKAHEMHAGRDEHVMNDEDLTHNFNHHRATLPQMRDTLIKLADVAPAHFKKSALDDKLEKLEKRCWKGYKPTPGKKAYSDGSCQPISKAEDESSQPKVNIMQSIVHHAKNDKKTGIPLIDNMIADAKGQSRIATSSEKAAAGIPEKPELFEPESQQFPEDQLVNQIKDHIASGKSTGIPLIDNMIADATDQKRMVSPAELAELRDNLKIRQQNDAKVIPLARPEPLAASEKDCDCKGCDCDKKQKEKIDPKALRKTLRDIRKSLGKNDE